MAIQNRRGSYTDFDPDKMVAGELAIVQDGDSASSTGRSLYVCFEAGVVKRIADYEDIQDEIQEVAEQYVSNIGTIVTNAQTATTNAETATTNAQNATTAANAAAAAATAAAADLSKSYVGMVIFSTTLNTMAKVVNFYGGTTWIQHSGYFLYGATSGVTSNSASSDGGEATHTLTVNEMPSHSHMLSSQGGYYVFGGAGTTVGPASGTGYRTEIGTRSSATTGGGEAHNNMPPYKNVYVWERTV